eukprot:gene5819-11120_t
MDFNDAVKARKDLKAREEEFKDLVGKIGALNAKNVNRKITRICQNLPIHEFTTVEENKRENTAAQEKDGTNTDPDIENDPSVIPETSLFEPTAVNMDDFTLDQHARKQFNLYPENNFQRAFDNLRKIDREAIFKSSLDDAQCRRDHSINMLQIFSHERQ